MVDYKKDHRGLYVRAWFDVCVGLVAVLVESLVSVVDADSGDE